MPDISALKDLASAGIAGIAIAILAVHAFALHRYAQSYDLNAKNNAKLALALEKFYVQTSAVHQQQNDELREIRRKVGEVHGKVVRQSVTVER